MKYNKGYIIPLFSYVLLFAVVILAISLVLTQGKPVVDSATGSINIKNAEQAMKGIENAIEQVAAEGTNSSRIIVFTIPGRIESIPGENSIQFETEINSNAAGDYFSRAKNGGIIAIYGNDVSCSEKDGNNDGTKDLVLENTFVTAVFTKTNRTASLGAINTQSNIIQMTEKTGNKTIIFSNSSIIIDDSGATSSGTGYSEILKTGLALPSCTAHFYINSTLKYDIYYELYAGADFITAEVRNIV